MRRLSLTLSICLTTTLLAIACGKDHGDRAPEPGARGGGGGGAGGEPGMPAPKGPLRLRFTRIDLPNSGEGGTDFRFVPGRSKELVFLTRKGSINRVQLAGDASILAKNWKVPGTLLLDQACAPTNLLFDPNYSDNQFVYLTYCVDANYTRLMRFDLSLSDGLSNPQVILETYREKGGPWHRFGSMGFEEDGETLWVLVGDNTDRKNGQNVSTVQGSLLRIKPSRDPKKGGYTPATGNMIDFYDASAGGAGSMSPEPTPEIYAYGFRSPFRGSRDSKGRFWVGDVGDATFEEVNLVTQVGQNFGWTTFEGPCEMNCDGFTNPLTYYNRGDHPYVVDDPDTRPATQRTVWVGESYDAPTTDRYYGKMNGVVPFGDLFTGWVRGLKVDSKNSITMDASIGHLEDVVAWHIGPDGYAYALTLDGNLHRAEFDEAAD